MQRATEDGIPVKLEFLCAECKAGEHGCPKLWRGLGLEIYCYCNCKALRGTAAGIHSDDVINNKDINPTAKEDHTNEV